MSFFNEMTLVAMVPAAALGADLLDAPVYIRVRTSADFHGLHQSLRITHTVEVAISDDRTAPDLGLALDFPALPAAPTVLLERVNSREAAIRRVVEAADAWKDQVQALLDGLLITEAAAVAT